MENKLKTILIVRPPIDLEEKEYKKLLKTLKKSLEGYAPVLIFDAKNNDTFQFEIVK